MTTKRKPNRAEVYTPKYNGVFETRELHRPVLSDRGLIAPRDFLESWNDMMATRSRTNRDTKEEY